MKTSAAYGQFSDFSNTDNADIVGEESRSHENVVEFIPLEKIIAIKSHDACGLCENYSSPDFDAFEERYGSCFA